MTWGTLEEEVVECFQRPQWQCGAAKVAASRVRESWIPRRKKHNCSSTTWEGSMEQAPSKHSRGPGEPFMCGSPPSFAPRGRGHILITKRSPFRQLGAHRSVGHLSMTKEQIALEPLQGNHSVAQEDGLAFFPSASLPQELRGHSLLGQVPAASLTLLKLPATWSAKLSGPSDCPWAVNSARTSLVLSITAGSRRFPAVNSQSIYVPFGLVNSQKKKKGGIPTPKP